MQEQTPSQFYVSNYHSKKALSKAVLSGAKIKILPIPLTPGQTKQNKEYSTLYGETGDLPNKLLTPLPNSMVDIQSSFNKEVPIYFATVVLDEYCNISKIF
jgi:hypothetical protein